MKILFRADCHRNIGTGHIFRCRGMADYFKGEGWDIQFLINDYEFSEKVVRGYDYKKVVFDCIKDEIKETKDILGKNSFDIIVVDFYEKCENDELMSVFASHAKQGVLAITDDFKKVNIKADFVIASDPNQTEYDYTSDKQIVLCGEKYSLVSPEFIKNKIEVKDKVENVLISFGGHDPYNVTHQVAKHIISASLAHDLSEVTFNFLIGGIYRHEEELRELLDNSGLKWKFHKDLKSVLPLFLENDMAITACGNILSELCHLNVPQICIGLNERQNEVGLVLHKKNLIEYAGYYADIRQEAFNAIFLKLLNSYEERSSLHDRCAEHFSLDPLREIYLIMKGEGNEFKR